MNDLTPEEVGSQLIKRVRAVAAEVAGAIRKDAEALLGKAEALHLQSATLSDTTLKALADATDLPAILTLLQAHSDRQAQVETGLLKRDAEVRRALTDIADLNTLGEAIALNIVKIDTLSNHVTLTMSMEKAANDKHRADLQTQFDVALAEVATLKADLQIAIDEVKAEKRSLAASRAHVTKTLDRLPSDMLVWCGSFDVTKTYVPGSLVICDGSTWVAKHMTEATRPAILPENPWDLVALGPQRSSKP